VNANNSVKEPLPEGKTMPKQKNTLTRRDFLKGTAYTSALSIVGIPSLALANSEGAHSAGLKSGIVGGATLSTVTLSNQSDKPVTLDPIKPVSLEKVNGWMVVKINKAAEQDPTVVGSEYQIVLAAGQEASFAVESELAPMLTQSDRQIVITNEYSALDNLVPITTVNTMVA